MNVARALATSACPSPIELSGRHRDSKRDAGRDRASISAGPRRGRRAPVSIPVHRAHLSAGEARNHHGTRLLFSTPERRRGAEQASMRTDGMTAGRARARRAARDRALPRTRSASVRREPSVGGMPHRTAARFIRRAGRCERQRTARQHQRASATPTRLVASTDHGSRWGRRRAGSRSRPRSQPDPAAQREQQALPVQTLEDRREAERGNQRSGSSGRAAAAWGAARARLRRADQQDPTG